MKDIEKVNGAKVIDDYINCDKIVECAKCEASKQIDCTYYITYCEFLRAFSSVARNKLEEVMNTIL